MGTDSAPSGLMRATLYFYSNRNIIGTGFAIAAASAAAAGIVQDYWWLVVAGSYGAGALITPSNARMDIALAQEMSDRDIIAGLERMAQEAPKRLPARVATDVEDICAMLEQAIPVVSRMKGGGSVGFDVRTTATQYLPHTLDRYLRMPPAFRTTVRTADGQTPSQMLAEQIGLLKTGLTRMMGDIASADADGIAQNGRFLKEKFATPEFAGII